MGPLRAADAARDAVDEGVAEPGEPEEGPGDARRRRRSTPFVAGHGMVVGASVLTILAVPLVVALVVLAEPRWYPQLDLAQTELRVRDVGTADSPLIGLAGRIGTFGEQGSHPGPVSFWALWPFYRLFGATSWALQAASVALHLVALAAILWTAQRRGGVRLVLSVAAVLAVLLRAYGPNTLTEAWNPHLPLLWWFLFLLAVWSLLCGDLPLLPVAVFAGSFGAQTHIPYLAPTAGLLALALAGVLLARRRGATGPLGRWVLVAGALAAVLWLPPLLDQLTADQGNLTKLWDHFSDPPEEAVGLGQGIELLLVHLDPWRLLAPGAVETRWEADGSIAPGLAVLAVWGVSVLVAWRLRHPSLLRLHLVLAAAMAVGALNLGRIFGYVWYYLSLWAGGVAALLFLAVGWTAAAVVVRRLDRRKLAVVAPAGSAAVAAVGIVVTALFTVDAAHAALPEPRQSRMMEALVPPTVEALRGGEVAGEGRKGRYLVTWIDPVAIGAPGFSLLLELERAGFDVAATRPNQAAATVHRVIDNPEEEAIAQVHLSVGEADSRRWRGKPGVEEVAYVDLRRARERVEQARLRATVIADLRAAGLSSLLPAVDDNPFILSVDRRVPAATRARLTRIKDLGMPTAVFVGPAGA